MKTRAVIIGVPAYNEEANIATLVESIYTQKRHDWTLKKVLIVLDGSEDATPQIAKQLQKKHRQIEIIFGKTRKGKSYRMNQILRHSDTELLLFLDADIKLGNALAITKMVRTFAHRPHILVAAAYQNPIPSDTLIGKINTTSFKVWYKLISSYRHGNNINCLMGSATMLRKSFYSQFHFPPLLICDQHYLYMSVIKVHRHSFCLVRGTNVLFHMVSTFKDSRLLGARSIYQDKMDLASRFGEEALREYAIPRSLKVQISMWAFMVMPWGFLGSIFLGLCIRAFPYYQKTQEALWIPLESSKGVIL